MVIHENISLSRLPTGKLPYPVLAYLKANITSQLHILLADFRSD